MYTVKGDVLLIIETSMSRRVGLQASEAYLYAPHFGLVPFFPADVLHSRS